MLCVGRLLLLFSGEQKNYDLLRCFFLFFLCSLACLPIRNMFDAAIVPTPHFVASSFVISKHLFNLALPSSFAFKIGMQNSSKLAYHSCNILNHNLHKLFPEKHVSEKPLMTFLNDRLQHDMSFLRPKLVLIPAAGILRYVVSLHWLPSKRCFSACLARPPGVRPDCLSRDLLVPAVCSTCYIECSDQGTVANAC